MKTILAILLISSCFACVLPNVVHGNFSSKRVAVIGTGYVGLVAGACFADFGHKVICADIDSHKINLLQKGVVPIFEPGLQDLVTKNAKSGHLVFTNDIDMAIDNADIVMIAVGTPMSDEGQADLAAVMNVVQRISYHDCGNKIICMKSTVPIGTAQSIKNILTQNTDSDAHFELVSNPEFLKEGVAVDDFLNPDRVVIGGNCLAAIQAIKELYQPLCAKNVPFLYTDTTTAETIKYASNNFLAVKIAFVNELARLCDVVGANMSLVTKGMGLDERIGHHFLKPGPGFGGSCFPKDMQALLWKSRTSNIDLKIIAAAWEANQQQPLYVVSKLQTLLDDELRGKTIAVLGLAFKAHTDDIRCSPAIPIIEKLIDQGACVKVYDPCAMDNMKKLFPHSLSYGTSAYDIAQHADAVLILTEWPEFKNLELSYIKELVARPIIVDARNILDTAVLDKLGFTYATMGNGKTEH